MMRPACTLLLCLFAFKAYTQVKADTLAPVEVKGLRVDVRNPKSAFEAGAKTSGIDSLTRLPYQNENLAVLLAGATTAFVKSYGFNSVATLSFRGASAAQSAVYWEGIPLANGATGLTDISLLPVSLIDSISLDYGSNAALYGSGNVGGAVMLYEGAPHFTDYLAAQGKLSGNIASFGRYSGNAILSLSGKRLFVEAGLEGMRSEGDFSAVDDRSNIFTTTHARQNRQTYKASLSWRANSRNLLTAHYWSGDYKREIPRALFEAVSEKTQRDVEDRLMLHWQHNGKAAHAYAKAAYFSNRFAYDDSAIALYSSLRTRQAFIEAGWSGRLLHNGNLLVFAPLQYASLADAPGSPTQKRAAIATAYTQALMQERLKIAASFRVESFDGKLIAMPGANAAYEISSALRIRANAQRTYRAPTLNELYYNPGGNADLKPEQGCSIDGGYDFQKNTSSDLNISHSLSAYNRNIRDWIIWLGGAIWTPHNLASVHSRGIETENSISGKWRQTNWRLGLNAAYTRSTTTESYLPGDNSIGRQIPYVPLVTGTGIAGLGWRAFYFEMNTTYTGLRYITSDESVSLPAYWLGNFRLRYTAILKKLAPITIRASINNIWNTQYAVVGFRPMPGINWSFGLSVHLQKTD